MDYCFTDKIDVKLIILFIIENFKIPIPSRCIIDIIMLHPMINYFDFQQSLCELTEEKFIDIRNDENGISYTLTSKGSDALSYFSLRIPKTVRERLIRCVKLKTKELKNEVSVKAEYKKVNDLEYKVNLGITEGVYDLFDVSISVGDEIMAKKICGEFKKDPQVLYSELLSVLIKDYTE